MKTKEVFFQTLKLSKVNAKDAVISGVSIITVGPAKGHYWYPDEGAAIPMVVDETGLAQIRDLIAAFGADGVKVKADHWTGFDAIVGTIKDPVIEGNQLRGDLHLLREDDSFARIIEMAEKMPSQFGLSISFSGVPEVKTVKTDVGTETQVAVARFMELYSVDLVDDPAANPSGLFSAVDSESISRMPEEKGFLSSLFGKDGTVTELQTALAAKRLELTAALAEVNQLKAAIADPKTGFEVKITNLTKERDEAVTKRDEFKAIIDKPDGEIEKRAGLKAKEITAALGQPPLEVKPGTTGGTDILAQFDAIKSPALRTEFYRKNKAAYDAAWAIANPPPKTK